MQLHLALWPDIMLLGHKLRGTIVYASIMRTVQSVPVVRSEVAGAMGALILGAFVDFMVGFAGASVLHEAAHNTRHSIAFPCH